MIQEIIKWAWLAIVLSFIISGILYGAGRGLRKTLFRGGWLIITALLLFLLVGPIIDMILGLDLSGLGINLSHNGVAATSLKDFFTMLICDTAGIENTVENAATIADVLQVIKLLLNVILFFVLFILFKWILYPLFALLYRLLFKGKAQKQYKKDLKEYKKACKQLKKIEARGFSSNNEQEFEETLTPIKEKNNSYNDILSAIQNKNNKPEDQPTTTSQPATFTKEPTVSIQEPEMADNSYVEDKIVEIPEEEKKTNIEKKNNLNHLVGKEQKTEKVSTLTIEKPVKPTKPKKHRLWGMLAGSVLGIFLGGVMLMPVAGVMNIINELNEKPATLIDESNTEDGLVTALIKQNAEKLNFEIFGEQITAETFQFLIDNYNNGIGGLIFTYTGSKALSTVTFNELSSTKIGDVKIYLKDDLGTILEVASQVITLKNGLDEAQSGYTVNNLNSILNQSENILNSAFSIQLIRGIGNKIIPIIEQVSHSVIDNSSTDEENKVLFKEIISAIISSISTNSNAIDSIKDDLLQVIGAIKNLNKPFTTHTNKSILTTLLNNNFEEDKFILLNHLIENKETVSELIGSTFNTKIVSSILPFGIYYITNYLSDLYDFSLGNAVSLEDFKELENIQTTITSIVSEGLNLIESIDIEKPSYDSITKTTFVCIGKIMDKLSNSLLPDETFANIIKMLETKLEELLPDLNFNGIDLNSAVKGEHGVLKSLSEITNWEEEFTILGTAFEGLFNGETPIISENIDFVRLGEKLDILATTHLFGAEDNESPSKINRILGDAIISFADNSIESLPAEKTEGELALYNIYTHLKDIIAPRLTTISASNANISWENEFSELNGILKYVTETLPTVEDLFAEIDSEDSAFVKLGIELDIFTSNNTSNLIQASDIYTLSSYALNYAKTTMDEMSGYLASAISSIANNIKAISEQNQNISFEQEFHLIQKIYSNLGNISTDDLVETCNTIGTLFDEIANYPNHSNIITNTEISQIVSGFIGEFADSISGEGVEKSISNLLYSIIGKPADNSTNPPTAEIIGTLTNDLAGTILGSFDNKHQLIADSKTFVYNSTNKTLKINDSNELRLNSKNQVTHENITYEIVYLPDSKIALRKVLEFVYISTFENSNKTTYENDNFEITLNGTTLTNLIKTKNPVTNIFDSNLETEINNITYKISSNGSNIILYEVGLDGNKEIGSCSIYSNYIISGNKKYTINLSTNPLTINSLTIEDYYAGNLVKVGLDIYEAIIDGIYYQLVFTSSEIELYKSYGFWENELSKLASLTEIADIDFSDITKLADIGKILDNVTNNGVLSSKLISNSSLANLMADVIIETKSTLTDGLSGKTLDIISKLIGEKNDSINESIVGNLVAISNNEIEINSWETELNYIEQLSDITDLNSIELSTIGETLDNIAYNYTSNNSLLITHPIITNMISSALDIFKPTGTDTTTTSIINAISSMQTNVLALQSMDFEELRTNSFKWQNELINLDTLKNISINSSNYKEDGKLASIGTTFDSIAFNSDESKNSLIITKPIINNLLADILVIAKSGSVTPTDFDNTISSITSNIRNLETNNYNNRTNFTWAEELGKFEELLSINFDSSDMGELLGHLVVENGLYHKNPSVFASVYGNEKVGAGNKIDELINNANPLNNSVVITREIIEDLLYSVISKESTTLSGDYDNIGNNIKNRLNRSHADYQLINSYENELKSINYILDITKVYSNLDDGLAISEMASIGSYFDDISSSILVGDSGSNVILIILDAYNNGESKPDAMNEINNSVKTRTALENADLIEEIRNNVEDVNSKYNAETNNYESLYRSLGEMRNTFSSLIDNISFTFTFESLTENAARESLMNMVSNISKTLEELELNKVCKEITSKYIAIYTLDKLISKLEEIHSESNLIPIPYPAGFDKEYQTSFMSYLVKNLNRNEKYFSSGWENSIPSDIVIPTTYDITGTNNSNGEFDFGLIKIVQSYLNTIPSV